MGNVRLIDLGFRPKFYSSQTSKKKISLETLKVYIQIKALAKYSNLLK